MWKRIEDTKESVVDSKLDDKSDTEMENKNSADSKIIPQCDNSSIENKSNLKQNNKVNISTSWNIFSVLSIVFTSVILFLDFGTAIASLALSIIGVNNSKKNNQKGKTASTVCVCINSVYILIYSIIELIIYSDYGDFVLENFFRLLANL